MNVVIPFIDFGLNYVAFFLDKNDVTGEAHTEGLRFFVTNLASVFGSNLKPVDLFINEENRYSIEWEAFGKLATFSPEVINQIAEKELKGRDGFYAYCSGITKMYLAEVK